jgi:hypothetical protein
MKPLNNYSGGADNGHMPVLQRFIRPAKTSFPCSEELAVHELKSGSTPAATDMNDFLKLIFDGGPA